VWVCIMYKFIVKEPFNYLRSVEVTLHLSYHEDMSQ
jgi:hypothetical protein